MKQFIKLKIPLGYTSTLSILEPTLPLGDYIFELDLVVRNYLNNTNNIGSIIVDYYMNDYYFPEITRFNRIIYDLRYLVVNDPPQRIVSDKIHIIHHNRL